MSKVDIFIGGGSSFKAKVLRRSCGMLLLEHMSGGSKCIKMCTNMVSSIHIRLTGEIM